MTDLLMVDLVGPGYCYSTIERGGLGGSELEVLQIAAEMTRRGHKVAVANRIDRMVIENGVAFVPAQNWRQYAPKRSLYLERMSAVDFGGPPPAGGTIVVRPTDIACAPYLVHKPILETGRAKLVGVSRWQLEQSGDNRRGFWYAKDKRVIAPILDPTPPAERIAGRFVYASNPCKGLQATVEKWLELRSVHYLPGAHLVIVLPGYVDHQTQTLPLELTDAMRAAGVSYAGAPTPDEYRRQIAMSEGLFFVNTMTETFGNVAAIAERAGVRTHILCRGEIGGLREALVDSSLVTRDICQFDIDFIQNFGRPLSQTAPQVPNRSREALGEEWERVLGLAGIARVPSVTTTPDVDTHRVVERDVPDRHAELYKQFQERLAAMASPGGTVSEYWRERCAVQSELARTMPVQDFLSWSNDVHHQDLPHFHDWYEALRADADWPRWQRLIRKTPYGNPHPFPPDDSTSPVTLQHGYHLMRFESLTGAKFTDGVDVVIEVGGGYGNFCRMLREDGFAGTHAIIDLPHQREFQNLFLELNGIGCSRAVGEDAPVWLLTEDDIPALLDAVAGKRVAFLATWSLSETPIAFRDKLFPALDACCTRYLMAVQWPKHVVDQCSNEDYFGDMVVRTGGKIRWHWETIVNHTGSIYLFGVDERDVKREPPRLEAVGAGRPTEGTFPVEDLPRNREPMPARFGEWLALQRSAIAPGGSEMGLALGLFFLAAATRAENIVEIGRFRGFSTLALAAGMDLAHGVSWQEPNEAEQRPDVNYDKLMRWPKQPAIWSIDPEPMPEADKLLARSGLAHYVNRVDHKSSQIEVKRAIDLLFIDGDHSLEGVKADIRRYVPKVKAGGYFVLHDYFGWWGPNGENGSPIKQAIEELLPGFERVLIDTGFSSFVICRKTADVQALIEPIPPRADGRPTVGLAMITRNEGHVIARALNSASKVGLDHMMVFVDDRTTDATADIARKLGAEVFIRPGATITDARNDAIRIAEQRVDYIVFLDPDDELDGTVDPRIGDADGYQFLIQDHGNTYPRLQMFRGKKGFHYHGIRHETLMPPKDGGVTLAVEHTLIYRRVGGGSWQDQHPPREKYLTHAKDLEKHIIDHPDDARSVFYLAQSYMDAGENDRARQQYERRISMGGFAEEVYAAHMMLARIDERTGADPVRNLLRAFEAAPHRAEPLVYAAVWLRGEERKRYALAYALASRASTIPMPPAGSFFIDAAVYQYQALCETGIAAFFSGQYQAALDAFTEAEKRVPPDDAELRGFCTKNIAVCRAKLAEIEAGKGKVA